MVYDDDPSQTPGGASPSLADTANRPALRELALLLRTARMAEGLSLRGLAQQAGVGTSSVHAAERGESLPKYSTLRILAKILKIDNARIRLLYDAASNERNADRNSSFIIGDNSGTIINHYTAHSSDLAVDMPDEISRNFQVVQVAMTKEAFSSIPMLARLIAEQVCLDRGVARGGKGISLLMAGLFNKGEIDSDIVDASRPLNSMIHSSSGPDEEKRDAEYCINFLTILLSRIYLINPAKQKMVESGIVKFTPRPRLSK